MYLQTHCKHPSIPIFPVTQSWLADWLANKNLVIKTYVITLMMHLTGLETNSVLEEDAQLELVLVFWLYSYVKFNSGYSTMIKPDNHPPCRFCLENEPGNSSVYMSHMESSINSFKIDRLHHYLISQTS